MSLREEIERLYRKYDYLLDYSKERQKQYIRQSNQAMEDYKKTGDHTSYQIAENNAKMSSRLCAESIAYKEFRNELKEALSMDEGTKKADAVASAGKEID